MICLNCFCNGQKNVCKFCDKCIHICENDCFKIKKENKYIITKMEIDEVIRGNRIESELKSFIPYSERCENCKRFFTMKQEGHKFCSSPCRRQAQNKRHRAQKKIVSVNERISNEEHH